MFEIRKAPCTSKAASGIRLDGPSDRDGDRASSADSCPTLAPSRDGVIGGRGAPCF